MTKLFMENGTILEVDNSIKSTSQACEQLNMSMYDISSIRVEGDNRPILVDYCANYCHEKYYVEQEDWSPEAVDKGREWRCSCSGYEEDYEEDEELYSFVECMHCDAPMHTGKISKVPSSYKYKEQHDNRTYYCVGNANKDAYCSTCGANYEY